MTTRVTVSGPVKRVVITPGKGRVSVGTTGLQGPPGPPGSGGVFIYDSGTSSYVLAPDARIFIQSAGDPAPTGLVAHDIHLVEQ